MKQRPILPLSDKEIVAALDAINNILPGNISYTLESGRSVDKSNINSIIENTTNFISTACIQWNASGNQVFIFYRSPGYTDVGDDYSASIQINNLNSLNIDAKKVDEVAKAALDFFNSGWTGAANTKNDKQKSDNIFALISAHVGLINKIETGISRNIDEFRKFIQESATESDRKSRALDSEYKRRLDDLEKRYQDRNIEFEKREDKIREKLQEIDISDNTTARRKIRSEIIETVSKRNAGFKLSNDTNKKREIIFVIFVITIISFLFLIIANAYFGKTLVIDAGDTLTVIFVKMFKNLVGVAGFFGTMFVFIRWQNSWAQRHADAEFAQRQFELDIHRASWAVESVLEWNRQTNSPIPPELIGGITCSLFDNGKPSNDDNTALDALASALLGQAQHVKVRQGENELEFGPKGLKHLSKTPLTPKSATKSDSNA